MLADRWWEQLFVDHHARVLATCRAFLRHNEEAEDATQEVFARVPADPSAIVDARRWLLEVARNVCIDIRRRQQRRPLVPLEAADTHAARAVEAPEAIIERLFVYWVLDQLPAREGAVLSRQLLLDESLAVAAARLGITYTVAGKLSARGKRRAAEIAARADLPRRNERRRAASSPLAAHDIRWAASPTSGMAMDTSCAVA